MNEKPTPTVSSPELDNNSAWKRKDHSGFVAFANAWYMLLVHFLLCVALSLAMVYALDGYFALNGTTSPRRQYGTYTLRTGDITTLISAALVLVKLTVSSWTALALWRCAFASLERGVTIPRLSFLLEWHIPRDASSLAIILVLLAVIPQAFIAPLITGAVNWETAYLDVETVAVQSGDPTANYRLWGWYQSKDQDRRAAVRRAAGMAGIAWATDVDGVRDGAHTSKRCRHIVNDDRLTVNSTLNNVTMPCLIIHNINWPKRKEGDVPSAIKDAANASTRLSISGDSPFSYVNFPGNAILFDQTNKTLKTPFTDSLDDGIFLSLGIGTPKYPPPFRFSGTMTAIVLLAKHYFDAPYLEDAFGYPIPNNNFTTDSSGGDLDLTYVEVNFTVGVTTAAKSTYISNQVIESNDIPSDNDIVAGPWVHEAMYLLPDVMSMVAIMNTTSLNSWNNLENYVSNLISYSYQGSWDMLQRSFDQNSVPLQATLRVPRIQATVLHYRVYAWLAISLLFTLSSLPLLWLRMGAQRSLVLDGPIALLLTDSSEVLQGQENLSNLTYVTDDDNVKVKLVKDDSSGRFKLIRMG